MGLDNPDTLYFGTRVAPGHVYVVSGVRGTTTDLSFQLLGGGANREGSHHRRYSLSSNFDRTVGWKRLEHCRLT